MHIRLRKILGLVFVLTAAIAAAGLLAGCGQAAYTAVFMADGEVIATVDCTDGVPVDTVPVPEKPGYTGAWGAAEWDGGRLVVTAAYTPNAYYITFKAYGDMTLDVVAYTTGDAAVEEPEVPVMYGYEGSWEPYSLAAGGNLTVRAVYTAIEYTVTYIADGQTIAVVTASAENPPAEPEVPEKAGYTGRWETSATDGYDYTMTAVYTPIHYCVVFTDDDRWRDFVYYTVEDTEIVEPEVPYKYGYEGSWEPYTLTYGDTVTVRAVYTRTLFSVTLQADGETGRLSGGGEHIRGETVTVTAEPYGGYAFSGWYDGEALVSEEASYTFTMPGRDVTYTARFAVRADMAPFTFTADARFCTVTGVTDPTVTELVVPDCVTNIAFNALGSCTSLKSLTVPVSDHSLGYWFGTDQVEYNAAYVPATLTEVTVTGGTSLPVFAFQNCTSLENIILPDTLTRILYNAFFNCKNLTEIDIPSGVTEISYSTFAGCSSLTEIAIPSGVTKIDNSTFNGCSKLTEIAIPSGVTSIGSYAFSGCSSLPEITIPAGVTEIGWGAFEDCTALATVTLPSGIRVLEQKLFSGCTLLRRVDLPSGLYSIGQEAFSGCESLTEVTIPSGVMEIGGYAFSGCMALTEITLPAGLTSIGGSFFLGCTALTEITLPSGVTSIGQQAFFGCESLTEIEIPAGVTEIGYNVFYGCRSLTEITLPSGVTSIGEQAFSGCTSLAEIALPSGVTSIGEDAFYACSSLTAVWYGSDEAAWADVSVDSSNWVLTGKVYFYSPDPPAAEGNYWHYADDGVTPVAW